jgi:leucine-rich repeat protein SHOC2
MEISKASTLIRLKNDIAELEKIKILERRIEQARCEGLTELDMSDWQIVCEINPEKSGSFSIKQLIWTNENNRLNVLPNSIGSLVNLECLILRENQITILPETVGNLTNLTNLDCYWNQISVMPENIGNLVNLVGLDFGDNSLMSLPKSIGNLMNLEYLDLSNNKLAILPKQIGNLSNLKFLFITGNPLTDLSILQMLPKLESVYFFYANLPRRYWTKFSDWKSEWLLDEDNASIRSALIEQVGYEKICNELDAITLDTWREYDLLRIEKIELVYDLQRNPIDREPMLLLKMTCPSTQHIHILRVPPEMTNAEAAINWVNHGIHPDEFAVQT